MAAVEKDLSVEYGGTVEKGGRWEPTTCTPRKKVRQKEGKDTVRGLDKVRRRVGYS